MQPPTTKELAKSLKDYGVVKYRGADMYLAYGAWSCPVCKITCWFESRVSVVAATAFGSAVEFRVREDGIMLDLFHREIADHLKGHTNV